MTRATAALVLLCGCLAKPNDAKRNAVAAPPSSADAGPAQNAGAGAPQPSADGGTAGAADAGTSATSASATLVDPDALVVLGVSPAGDRALVSRTYPPADLELVTVGGGS